MREPWRADLASRGTNLTCERRHARARAVLDPIAPQSPARHAPRATGELASNGLDSSSLDKLALRRRQVLLPSTVRAAVHAANIKKVLHAVRAPAVVGGLK